MGNMCSGAVEKAGSIKRQLSPKKEPRLGSPAYDERDE
jgi:hypothetical protein